MATSTLGNGTLVLAGTTSGTTTVTATAVAGTTTLTLPAATDTLVGKATTDTLTNKTLTSPTITGGALNGTVGATTPATGAFTTVQIGTNPAGVSIGVLGIPNQKRVYGRNAANSADVNILYVDGSNGLVLGPSDAAVIDASGNLGIGTTLPKIELQTKSSGGIQAANSNEIALRYNVYYDGADRYIQAANKASSIVLDSTGSILFYNTNTASSSANSTITGWGERARIDSSGNLLVGKSGDTLSVVGGVIRAVGSASFTATSNEVLDLNRLSTDGKLQRFYQDTTEEGNISVSGTTVSYNGGHLSRWAQTTAPKDESIVKGTVLSNLDAMNVYTDADGNPVDNEQLNKVKVSDVEGDANVAGVFVNWSHDEDHNVDEINMAMTGDMIIRIAQGTTVARGDLLMSAGDGTAKPQGDDIVRSKTVAKVTSTHVTCTYSDGSYCVPCVLMAC